jgi:glycosyltransferase EpsJ
LEALLRSERVFAIPDPLYFYTVNNPDSSMSSPYKPLLESSLLLQYAIRKRLSIDSGLLQYVHYRKDMAHYYLKSIYRMLINNLKNNPAGGKKSDLARMIQYDMFSDSTREIGFFYRCRNLKEYMYYLALKFKFYALIYDIEFHRPRSASFLSFLLKGRKNTSKKCEH